MRRRQLGTDEIGGLVVEAYMAVDFAGVLACWAAQAAMLNDDERRRVDGTEYAARIEDVRKLRHARWADRAVWLTDEQRTRVELALAELPEEAREWVLALAAGEVEPRGALVDLIGARFGPP